MDSLVHALALGGVRRSEASSRLLNAYHDLVSLLRMRLAGRPGFEPALLALFEDPCAENRAAMTAFLTEARVELDAELGAAILRVHRAARAVDASFSVEAAPLHVPKTRAFTLPTPGERPVEAARIVNTGFTPAGAIGGPIDPGTPLALDTDHFFWLEVAGERLPGAIDASDAPPLPVERLPRDAVLRVTLFGFEDELRISRERDVGRLRLRRDGSWCVARRAASPRGVPRELLDRRLFFAVRTPGAAGRCRLRCNLYFRQVLVQSLLIEADVGATLPRVAALRSTVDYTLSRSLRPEHLAGLAPHRLSLMLNRNGDGSHGFRFFGEGDFKADVTLDGLFLQNLIDQARRAERMAAWGDEQPFGSSHAQKYRYDGAPDLVRLKGDLVMFAKRGYRFYDALIGRLTGSEAAAQQLTELMRTSGDVQIALKDLVSHVPPAAMIYDHPFDTTLDTCAVRLCPAFLAAFERGRTLHDHGCFDGECPTLDQDPAGALDLVCPSGFWGFRHRLGLPVAGSTTPDTPVSIPFRGRPEIAVGVSTDPNFHERPEHERRLRRLFADDAWHWAGTRRDVLAMLGGDDFRASLVYFYCHGGLTADALPYILVGDPATEKGITRDILRARKIRWDGARPLVFLNGCHTTAVEPEQAIDLVTGFVETARAAGVIGTEISVFEPLAAAFAEACLQAFTRDGQTIGEAIRRARLTLLGQGNPLGLIYVPFVLSTLRLVEQP